MRAPALTLHDLAQGDFVSYWRRGWDNETDRPADELCYARVLRKGPKRVRVQDRDGKQRWEYPRYLFAKIDDPETIADLLKHDFQENQ